MLYRFLRLYLRDKEFEHNKIQLKESQSLLSEYKDFIQREKNQEDEAEKKRVDPDFLVMIWASLGLALTIGAEAVSNIPKVDLNNMNVFGVNEIVWLVIVIYIVFYITYNGMFAMTLTRDYAKSKENKGYRDFAATLIIGIILLFAGLVIIAQFGTSKTS